MEMFGFSSTLILTTSGGLGSAGKFFYDRLGHPAGSAPGRPEIDQHWQG
jgi:hypothetical protein